MSELKPPKKIYLQMLDEDGEEPEETTWCEDELYDTDIAYVLQSSLTVAQEENAVLRHIIQDFKAGFEHDIFGVLPNGNVACGYDEGTVRGNEFLQNLRERYQSALNGGK
jgi:hypothetical protein